MSRGEGLRVQMAKIPGITDAGLLPQPFSFQCPPLDEFTVEYAHNHSDYDTVGAGQFSRRGGVQLRTCSFETLFVDWGLFTVPNYAGQEVEDPIETLAGDLIEITESGSPFLLTVAHQFPPGNNFSAWDLTLAGPELQMPATLRNLRVSERAGEGDARYISCSFTEYRDPVVARSLKGKRRSGGSQLPITGRIDKASGAFVWSKGNAVASIGRDPGGVTLRDLSKNFYKTPTFARQIADANQIGGWGGDTPIKQHPRYRKGGKFVIPRKGDSRPLPPNVNVGSGSI